MRKLAIVGLVVTPSLYAQSGPLPVNSGSVDYITMVTSSVDHLVTSGSPLFLSTGNQLLSAIGIIMLVTYGLKWAAFSAVTASSRVRFSGTDSLFCALPNCRSHDSVLQRPSAVGRFKFSSDSPRHRKTALGGH